MTRKRGQQDVYTEISSETHHFTNIDSNYNTCDIGDGDKDPRPAKRRKRRVVFAIILTISRGYIPELHVGQPGPLMALSTTIPEIDDA